MKPEEAKFFKMGKRGHRVGDPCVIRDPGISPTTTTTPSQRARAPFRVFYLFYHFLFFFFLSCLLLLCGGL